MNQLDRRAFLKVAGVGIGALTVPAHAAAQTSPDVVVVGAGAFGGWTALHLREKGASVTLLDAYGPGNSRASSGGETRQIELGPEDSEIYAHWVLKGFDMWKARQEEFGRRLFYQTGRLHLAAEGNERIKTAKILLDNFKIPNELLTPDQLRRRYPQMNPEAVEIALFEPTAAILKAREGCLAVVEVFQKKGGRFRIEKAKPGRQSGGRLLDTELADGSSLAASTFVFACGPWLRKVFPELLKKKLFTPRREVFFFGPPEGDDRFNYPNFPNYEDNTQGYYGFPSIDGRGFKVVPVGELTVMDPDSDERVVSTHQVKRARDYLTLRFPALKAQPVVETRVCQLELSIDNNFIVQKHPAFENVWLVGGGSGRGYKHGPLVGEYVADRVLGQNGQPELEQIFRLKAQTF